MKISRITLLLMLLALARPAHARECAYYGTGIDYGLDPAVDRAFLQERMGSVRISIKREANMSDYPWSKFDQIVGACARDGIDPLLLVLDDAWGGTPAGDWNNDSTLPNPFINAMVGKVAALLAHYPTIHYVELWNEPNIPGGNEYLKPDVFAKLLAEVYVNVIRPSNGRVHLILGALYHGVGVDPCAYMDSVYADGLWDWTAAHVGRRYVWDGVAYHPYVDRCGTMPQSDMLAYINSMQSCKVAHADYVPLWVTEFGWCTSPPCDACTVDYNTQATNIGNALSVFESRGDIARTFQFTLNEGYLRYGLFDGNWAPKPSAATYAQHSSGCTYPCSRAGTSCNTSADCCGSLTCTSGQCDARTVACTNPDSAGNCQIDILEGDQVDVALHFVNKTSSAWPADAWLATADGQPSPLANSRWRSSSLAVQALGAANPGATADFLLPLDATRLPGAWTVHQRLAVSRSGQNLSFPAEVVVHVHPGNELGTSLVGIDIIDGSSSPIRARVRLLNTGLVSWPKGKISLVDSSTGATAAILGGDVGTGDVAVFEASVASPGPNKTALLRAQHDDLGRFGPYIPVVVGPDGPAASVPGGSATPSGSSGGCGCSLTARDASPPAALFLLALSLFSFHVRRRGHR